MHTADLEREKREAVRDTKISPVKPTEEEKKNGWTTQTLTKYLTERLAGQSINIDINSLHRQVIPNEQNHKYSVKRWRS